MVNKNIGYNTDNQAFAVFRFVIKELRKGEELYE